MRTCIFFHEKLKKWDYINTTLYALIMIIQYSISKINKIIAHH
jgi:hypothetical protein